MPPTPRPLFLGCGLVGFVGALAACSIGDLDLSGRTCPCVDGYVCDETHQLCIMQGSASDAGIIDAIVAGDCDLDVGRASDGPLLVDHAVVDQGAGGGDADAPVLIASLGEDIAADGVSLATDGVNVYVAGSMVLAVPVAGGEPVTLASSESGSSIAVGGGRVYWADESGIRSVATTGGKVTTFESADTDVTDLAVDSKSVYWADGAYVESEPIGGGAMVTLATGPENPSYVAVNAADIFISDISAGVILATKLTGGGAVSTLASLQLGPVNLAVGPSSVYWMTGQGVPGQETISSVPLTGGSLNTTVPAQTELCCFVVDESFVYWATFETLVRTTFDGSETAVIARGLSSVVALTDDATRLFFLNGSGDLYAVPK